MLSRLTGCSLTVCIRLTNIRRGQQSMTSLIFITDINDNCQKVPSRVLFARKVASRPLFINAVNTVTGCMKHISGNMHKHCTA